MTPLHPAFLDKPIAHRGLNDIGANRPENSLAAIDAAIEKGYGVELDLQLTLDNAAVVFHDDVLDRLTFHSGPVRARKRAELLETELKGGGTIPDLSTVLARVAGRVPVLLEIKDQDGAMGPNVGALERAIADDLQGYDGPVAVMSFNPHSVAAFGEMCPDVPRGLVTCSYAAIDWDLPVALRDELREIPDFKRVGASFISHQWQDLSRPRVQEIKKAGAAVLCWTIRTEQEEAEARKVAQNVTFERYLP